ncbi:apoptosis inhibitor 5-like [Macrosteles quadrilineatus]|uniref:apoptosis inhibitor 5-like n=1 Tax=Macrosteles quadrilineatus TaxID=74068 RepID=UPI0023E17CCA|nr:apoptosis inhibitor 5-like [Macrosteles quadrilineatus]XP_054281354.1 apoptosis inhibitor 5-like [Macrosteles quadrilineatus]
MANLAEIVGNIRACVISSKGLSLKTLSGPLEEFFQQILTGEEAVRERCLKFLVHYVKKLDSDVFNKEAEDLLIAECKKVLQAQLVWNDPDAFDMVMDLLGLTHLAKSVVGQRELVEIVAEQVQLSQLYNPADKEQVDKLLHGLKRALPFFSAQVDSQKFVEYLCEQVLPTMPVISASNKNSANHSEIFKLLAELCSHCNTISNPETHTATVLKKLIEYMPLPSASDDIPEPNLKYSYVECLMYSLYKLARHCPDIITKDPEKLEDFWLRLKYFAGRIQGYKKKKPST